VHALRVSRFSTEPSSDDVVEGSGSRKLGRRTRRQRGAVRGGDPQVPGNEILLFAASRAKLLRPLGLASFVQAGGWLLMLANGPSLPA
jgi:hypothetical protein